MHAILSHLLSCTLSKPLLKCCLFNIPIIHEIKVESFPNKCLSKHANELLIIRFFFKFQFSGVIQEMLKFFGVTRAKVLNAGNCLLDLDLLILFLLGLGRKPLPRERAPNEVHEHNAYLLEVVSPGLLDSQMCVQRSISRSSSERLVVLE